MGTQLRLHPIVCDAKSGPALRRYQARVVSFYRASRVAVDTADVGVVAQVLAGFVSFRSSSHEA